MKLHILASILSLALAGTVQGKAVNLDLQGASISEVVQLIYREATTTLYVLALDVLEDERLVSFRYKDNQGKLSLFMQYFLDSLGYMVERKSGVDFVRKRAEGEPPIQAEHIYIYQPQYREVSYLSRTLAPLFKGSFVTNRSVRATPEASPKGEVPISSAASLIDQSSDVLVFAGAEEEIERLRELLPQVDRRMGEVAVRGLVYEVSNTDRQGSAFGLLANLLGGHVGIGIGSTATNLGNFIQTKTPAWMPFIPCCRAIAASRWCRRLRSASSQDHKASSRSARMSQCWARCPIHKVQAKAYNRSSIAAPASSSTSGQW